MTTPQAILGHISGGRVLDVATGSGNFIHFLLEGLKDYAEILGIDTSERAGAAFEAAFKENPKIQFKLMDILHPDFDEASFDLVCISNSLHHFTAPLSALRQMKRLLRPGGHFIIAEMYHDDQTETQQTHVLLHHWWASIDRLTGVVHNETYRRLDIVEMVATLRLLDLRLFDLADLADDPKAPEIMAELNPGIDRYLQRAEGHPDLQMRGEELRRRAQEIGFHGATTLIAVGKKS